jgi:serine/threonine-protein kinase
MDQKSGLGEQMPTSIGRYQVQGGIGYGAMGAVYKAFDPLIKRTLAIKTIRLDIPRNSPQYKSFIERFYHEARISGTLSHPNIVTLFDIGEEQGIPYLAMEFVEGETIASMIERGVKFPPEKVISLVSQVASAIDYAHTKGVIHRDIKPANMILSDDRLKVTDFGIAKLVDSDMTQAGQLLGTPSYMSPEQAMGDSLDGRSDIFSLGVCAFEMLSGEQPFPGTNVTSILYKLVHVDPIEPANLEMHGLVPQKWHEVFSKVLAKKPDDRYQNGAAFVQDLEFCLGSWFGAMGGSPDVLASATVATPTTDRTETDATPAPEVTATLNRKDLDPAATPPPYGPPAATLPSRAPAQPTRTPIEDQTAPLPRVAPPVVEDESPMTVQMKAPAIKPPAFDDTGTVAMKAPVIPPKAPTGEETIAVKAAPAAARATAGSTITPALPPTLKQPIPVLDTPTLRAAAPRAVAPTPTPPAAPPPPPAPPAAKSGTPRKGASPLLILGVAAAFFVVAIVILGVYLMRQLGAPAEPSPTSTPAPVVQATVAPPPETQAPAVRGQLHVETTPPGANISVNGEARGVSPLDIADLAIGNYDVRAELRGYAAASETVTIVADAPNAEVRLSLGRTAPTQGTLEIASNPAGGALSVDGAPAGQTPVTDLKLKPGSHRLQVSYEGYEPWSGSVIIEAGRKARVEAILKAIPRATPTPPPQVDLNRIFLNTASDVDQVAKKTGGASASYPPNAPRLKSGDSVSVSVSFVVDEKGDVVDPKVIESAGKQIDEAVLAAIRKWKYQPATKQGAAVKVKITFKQTFRAG